MSPFSLAANNSFSWRRRRIAKERPAHGATSFRNSPPATAAPQFLYEYWCGRGHGPNLRAADLRGQCDIDETVLRMRRAPQPVIACVHGAASGGGFAIALAADVRIGGESARMNAAFVRLGLSGCDMGVSYFLPRIVGASVAAELLLTGDFIDAARAQRVGLVSRVVPDSELESAARPLAGDMIRNSPLGLWLTKDCLRMRLDAGSLDAALAMEDRNQMLAIRGANFGEGVRVFVEKRPARCQDE